MIVINNKRVTKVPNRNYKVIAIYVRGKKVWPDKNEYEEDIHSCFALGYWINNEPWTDDYPWKNYSL